MKQPPPTPTSPHQQADKPPHNQHILSIWGCAQVVDGLFMRLLSRPNGSWALQLAALTPRCAAKPYWWQYGQAAHTAILMCPGYCGEYLRPDWRFGMSGQRKYSMELRERATRMALEARADPERRRGAIKRIGGQLGVNPEALRTWVRAVEQGGRNERGEISDQEARIRALEAENRELRRANEILKAASAFFGAEPGRLGR